MVKTKYNYTFDIYIGVLKLNFDIYMIDGYIGVRPNGTVEDYIWNGHEWDLLDEPQNKMS